MEKRDFKRIPANLILRFPSCNTVNLGTLANLSASGMYIQADVCFPIKSRLNVLVQLKDEILDVPVKIVRIVKSGNFYQGIGVKVLKKTNNYLELLMKLNYSSQS